MKRIIYSLLVASLGGLIALGGYKLMEPSKPVSFEEQQKVNYVKVAGKSNGLSSAGLPDFTVPAALSTPAVVHITTIYRANNRSANPFMDPFEFFHQGVPMTQEPQKAFGSGVIISADGYIVTNNHVIQDANNIQVVLENKQQYKAKLIGTDPSTDIALLKIQAENLPVLKFGNSDEVKVGEWVLAVGNPFNLTSTVTAGIVSAKARNIGILGGGHEEENPFEQQSQRPKVNSNVESFIQTDAAVNRGNSGGALVNVNGELIGINSAIASGTGNYEGYSFAVPVNLVKKVVDDLRNYGTVQRGFLGVQIQDVTAEFVNQKKLIDKEIRGVYVAKVVPDGSAKEAGIQEGDIILKVQGVDVNSNSELQEQVARYRPGNTISVTVLRNGQQQTYSAVLKNSQGTSTIEKNPVMATKGAIGLQTLPLSPTELKKFNKSYGVKIVKVDDGIFKTMGVRPGFVVLKINDQEIHNADDLESALNTATDSIAFEGFYENQPNTLMSFQQSFPNR